MNTGIEMLERGLDLSKVEKLSSVVRSCTAGPDSVRPEGAYYVAMEPNSFGLPSVDTCPGKTNYCELDCYAIEAEKRTATHRKLQRNLDILTDASDTEGMANKLRHLVSGYAEQADKLRVAPEDRRFRIHWSGDFFSLDYTEAWRTVIAEHPGLHFFAYTRSFQPDMNVLPILSDLPNLDLFLSVDNENADAAVQALKTAPNARVAYLVDYQEEAQELIDKLGRTEGFRQVACPENMRDEKGRRKLPVISEKGGACSRCTYCINKPEHWDVIFVKEGYKQRPQNKLPFPEAVPITIRRRAKTAPAAGAVALGQTQAALF